LPGALVMLGLSALYVMAWQVSWLAGMFLGIKAAVLAIVAQALIRIAGRALNTSAKQAIAVLSFVLLFLFNSPFPLVILGAGIAGALIARRSPELLGTRTTPTTTVSPEPVEGRLSAGRGSPSVAFGSTSSAQTGGEDLRPPNLLPHILKTTAIWGSIWAAPMVLIYATLGPNHVLWDVGSFFSQLAVVTFGGAYAVLAYMAQEAVNGFAWLSAGEMADGLGLAETTPGPLILVTQFTGFLAGFRTPAPFDAWTAGILAAGLTTWVTFAPCFLWIFALAPAMDRLRSLTWLQGSLSTITAAVVGVIANLSLWFALHVLFREVGELHLGPARIYWPEWSSFDWRALLIGAGAAVLLFRLKLNIIKMLAVAALAGMIAQSF
ncbi:chromate transporter, partial [Sphingorhabdus sp.]|uniref:chromate transporter n=1 Tax=Sphingorhabdus sp. TaxID=1902408 RepID=UPI0032B80F0C